MRLALATISSTWEVLPVPSLDLVAGGLPDLHSGIEPQCLDDERSSLRRDAKALFLTSFHTFDEAEYMRKRERHVLIVFSRLEAVQDRKLFSEKGRLFPPRGNKT
jgi:hypothetical protein